MSTLVDINHVSMTFTAKGQVFNALENVNIQIAAGEFVSLIGHSGCGKSTVLNLVAGLLLPTQGGVLFKDREIDGPGPERAVVFQNHSLLPWLTVFDNVLLAVDQVAADLSRGCSAHDILGVAAVVGLRAIEYRQLYPQQ